MKNPERTGFTLGRVLLLTALSVAAFLVDMEARGADKPLTQLVQPLQPFATEQDAAVSVLSALLSKAPTVEWGGVVYECFGQFFVSVPVTQNLPHDVDYVAQGYNDCRIAATYHVHPTLSWTADYFSETDLATLKSLKINGWLGVVASGKIRRQAYDGPTEVVQFGSTKMRVTLGEEIAKP